MWNLSGIRASMRGRPHGKGRYSKTAAAEYSVAELRGSSTRERTRRLIIHPNFRDELERKTREIDYL